MFYDGWKRASARLGRPSHPSALLPSWTGACRALGGSRERVGTQDPSG